MTGKARAPGTSDESFLDLVFERAVVLIESGTNPVAEDLLDGREHLRAEIEALLRTARQATLVAPEELPSVRGFVLEAEIGRGGMGTVYLARQEALGNRRVALKILPASALLSPRARERFVREARSIAHVRHPNVVTVHDVVAEADVCAYAMEWVDGASLSELIDHLKLRGRRPGAPSGETRSIRSAVDGEPTLADVRELLGATAGSDRDAYPVFVCRIAVAIARALGELHRAGLVHRDVKPSNVLLRRDGTALLSDFGLVHETDGALTQSGQFVGTIAYASPEQLGGDPESLDARSDVYALGVTLYQALTLHLPFDHWRGEARRGQARSTTTPTGMLRLIESGRAAPLRARNRRLPRDLETIVAKAMDPDRSRRYASADGFADDLERMLNFQPIQARPAGPATRGVKLLRRNRAAALGIVGGSIVSLALATLVVAYAFLVPDWVRAHVREARLILLDPAQANDIFVAVLWGRPPGLLGTRVGDPALEEALAQYEAALRWSPFDEEIRSERDAIRDLLRPSQEPSPTLAEDEHGLRAAGLSAYLRGDVEAALRSWEQFELRHEPTAAPDPLVEAGLGVLCLVREEAARAYPRLRDACQALPDVAFLTTYQADAAVSCRDLDTAEQLLDAAASMPRADPMFGTQRVRADLLAARGRDAEAEGIYRKICTKSQLANLHYARFLRARGRTEEAVDWYARVALALHGKIVQREYVTALESWWAGLTGEQRLQHVRSTLERLPTKGRWLVERLRVYLAAARIVAAAGTVAPGSSDPGSARDSRLSQTARDDSSSRSLQRQTLNDLATTLEAENMTRWNEIQRYPRVLDELQVWAWRSPWPHALSGAIEFLASPLIRRTPPAPARDEGEETKMSAALTTGRVAPRQGCPDAPCFEGLGDLPGGGYHSVATCLSADGTTVGGASETSAASGLGGPAFEAFRWRADTGMVYMGDLPGNLRVGQVNALSADGEVAVGWSSSGNGDNAGHNEKEAFRWTGSGGMTGLGDAPGGGFESSAEGISDDGSVIAGYVDDGNCYRRGAFWTQSAGWTIKDDRTPETGESTFLALSRDGRWVAGDVTVPCTTDSADACRWSETSSLESLGVSYDAHGLAVSDLGEVAGRVGEGWAFVTSADGEILFLEDLPGGGDGAEALGILPGGELIVGLATSAAGQEAVLWDESRALHRVADVLSDAGVSVPAGWVLMSCADITRNGRVVTLCGTGVNPGGDTEAWIARYELAHDLHRLSR